MSSNSNKQSPVPFKEEELESLKNEELLLKLKKFITPPGHYIPNNDPYANRELSESLLHDYFIYPDIKELNNKIEKDLLKDMVIELKEIYNSSSYEKDLNSLWSINSGSDYLRVDELIKKYVEESEDKRDLRNIIYTLKTFTDKDLLEFNDYKKSIQAQEGGKKSKKLPKKEILGKMRCIYKIPGDRKEYVKHKGKLITVKDYKELMKAKKTTKPTKPSKPTKKK